MARTPAASGTAAPSPSASPSAPAARSQLARSARPSAAAPHAAAPARRTGAPAGVARTPAAASAPAGAASRAPRGLARSAAAAAASPAPAAAPARPALTLVPTPPPEEPTPATRSIARAGVDDLASATGGDVAFGEDGMATVDFTGSGGMPAIPAFSTAPVTVSREVADTAPAPAPSSPGSPVLARAEVDAPAATTAHQAPANDSEAPEETDSDEIYEKVVDRLRRDLIAELEQHGHLLRETL